MAGIVDSLLIKGNVNAENFELLLQNGIVPAIQTVTRDDIENTWFQQEGAAPHFVVIVSEFLHETFFEKMDM